MTGRRPLPALLLAVVAVLAAGCADGDAAGEAGGGDATPATTSADSAASAGATPWGEPETVVSGLDVPWALAFVDETTVLVTERPGRVRVVRDGRLEEEPAAELPVADEGEGGLLGVALHPAFPDDRFAYLYYTAGDVNRLSRFPVGDDLRFGAEEVLLGDLPAARFHDGGRIAFGPDGMLYVATGDAGEPDLAADRSSPAGKILRLRPDGGVPDDNPFPGSPVFSYGHRNVQGLDWDGEGRLFASEHGPTGEFGMCCHDEVNLIRAGGFHGWPYFAGETSTGQGSPPEEPVPPLVASGTETWAPAGLAVDDRGGAVRLLVAGLAGERLLGITVEGDEAAGVHTALDGLGRLRAATFGPDRCLWLTTSNTDGRGEPRPGDDRIARACPRS